MVEWGNYGEAYKAIHDAIRSALTSSPEGKTVDSIDFTYDADGDITTIAFKEGAATLFTLTFAYDANKNISNITRS